MLGNLKGAGVDFSADRGQRKAAGLRQYGSAARKRVEDSVVLRSVRFEQYCDQFRRKLSVPGKQVTPGFAIYIKTRIRNSLRIDGNGVQRCEAVGIVYSGHPCIIAILLRLQFLVE